jgi:hypothetical protein
MTDWLRAAYRRLTGRTVGRSPSNEVELLAELLRRLAVPHTFCEFGFGPGEFNCAGLVEAGWRGLLIDGDQAKVQAAAATLPARVVVREQLLDRENVQATIAAQSRPARAGLATHQKESRSHGQSIRR